jgi:hypothetical protein
MLKASRQHLRARSEVATTDSVGEILWVHNYVLHDLHDLIILGTVQRQSDYQQGQSSGQTIAAATDSARPFLSLQDQIRRKPIGSMQTGDPGHKERASWWEQRKRPWEGTSGHCVFVFEAVSRQRKVEVGGSRVRSLVDGEPEQQIVDNSGGVKDTCLMVSGLTFPCASFRLGYSSFAAASTKSSSVVFNAASELMGTEGVEILRFGPVKHASNSKTVFNVNEADIGSLKGPVLLCKVHDFGSCL